MDEREKGMGCHDTESAIRFPAHAAALHESLPILPPWERPHRMPYPAVPFEVRAFIEAAMRPLVERIARLEERCSWLEYAAEKTIAEKVRHA